MQVKPPVETALEEVKQFFTPKKRPCVYSALDPALKFPCYMIRAFGKFRDSNTKRLTRLLHNRVFKFDGITLQTPYFYSQDPGQAFFSVVVALFEPRGHMFARPAAVEEEAPTSMPDHYAWERIQEV